MTVSIEITPEQAERLKALAAERGVDMTAFATAVLIHALEDMTGKAASRRPCPIGLAKGEFVVPDDFDAPLPDKVLREFE